MSKLNILYTIFHQQPQKKDGSVDKQASQWFVQHFA